MSLSGFPIDRKQVWNRILDSVDEEQWHYEQMEPLLSQVSSARRDEPKTHQIRFVPLAFFKHEDRDAVRRERVPVDDEEVMWLTLVWIRELIKIGVPRSLYLYQPSFWDTVSSEYYDWDDPVIADNFFNRQVALFPIFQPDKGHWIAGAVINPAAIWDPEISIPAYKFPIILCADSNPNNEFDLAGFERMRKWFNLYSQHLFPDKPIHTKVRLGKLEVPHQDHPFDSGYHMLVNLRQILEHRDEILKRLTWEKKVDNIMVLDLLSDGVFDKIWEPEVFTFRKEALKREMKMYRDFLEKED